MKFLSSLKVHLNPNILVLPLPFSHKIDGINDRGLISCKVFDQCLQHALI